MKTKWQDESIKLNYSMIRQCDVVVNISNYELIMG